MGNTQTGDKPPKAGKSPGKSKNFIKNLNRKSPGRDSNKKHKKERKQSQSADKSVDSDNEALVISDCDPTFKTVETTEREGTLALRGAGEGESEGQVTVPTCADARSTNRERTPEERLEHHNRALSGPAQLLLDNVPDKSDRIKSPTKDSSSDSVFTDPLTPLAFAAEINQCYYSAESDSTLESGAIKPSDDDAKAEVLNMPQSGVDDDGPAENNEEKKEIDVMEVSDGDSCWTKDEKVMGSLLSSPKSGSAEDAQDAADFMENRLKASAAQTCFTLSRHRRVELPPTKLMDPCLSAAGVPSDKEEKRFASLSEAPALESNVLRKVASLTLDHVSVEGRPAKPKFVPEKLDFQIYEKFEGQMLVNWFVSSVSDDKYMKNLLSLQDLRTLGTQYCTHLLAAGVLKQLPDRDAPPDAVFRPDLMYYWAHTEPPGAQPITPGRIQMLKWPPNFENAQKSKSTGDSLSKPITHDQVFKEVQDDCNIYCSVPEESNLNLDEAKSLISRLKQHCESLQFELEKYKTLSQIQTLTQNAQEDILSSPKKKEKAYSSLDALMNKKFFSAINDNDLALGDKLANKTVINLPEIIADNLDVIPVQTIELSSIKRNEESSIINETPSRLNGNGSARSRSDEVENYCKLNKCREQMSIKIIKEKSDVVMYNDDDKESVDDDKINGLQSTEPSSDSLQSFSSCEPKDVKIRISAEPKLFDATTIENKMSVQIPRELPLITSTPLKGDSAIIQIKPTKQNIASPDGSSSPTSKISYSISSVPVSTTQVSLIAGTDTPSPPMSKEYRPLGPLMPKEFGSPSAQMPIELGPTPPPMPIELGPTLPPMPAELGPPPPSPPIPDIGPPPPPISGMGPLPLPMSVMGQSPPPMPGIGPPPPPMPGMGPVPPPMPGMGPPPPPMPGMGPPPPPMPGMGPPPPPMPGMGPPPPPMPGIGPPPPPMPEMGPPPPPMAGMGPPPPPMTGMGPATPLSGGNNPGVFPPTGVGPPPPPMSGPLPFPAPPAGGWNQQRAALRKTPVVPVVPMKPLYWTRILAPPTVPLVPEAPAVKPVWVEIEETSLDNIDEFTDLFSRQVVRKKPAKKKVESRTKIQPMKVLDSKRSQNVGILAQSLHVKFSEIENAIYNFDTSVVSLEALHQIYELRATDEELALIKEHLAQKSDVPLDKPETFLHDLSGIPNFAERISCFMFQAEFEDSIATVMHKLDNLKHTCEFLMSNEDLKRLLAIILTLGNYMNGGNGQRGQADGFGLEILSKLRDVKSKESTVTLLHFIVRTYVRRSGGALSPECALPVPEPGDVARAAALDFQDTQAVLQHLAQQLQGCRNKMKKVVETDEAILAQNENLDDSMKKRSVVFKEKMSTFLDVAEEKLKMENENWEECKSKFIAMVKFYQYTPKTGKLQDCEPKEFFGLWMSFCTDFKDIFKKEEQIAIKEKLKETKKQKEDRKAQAQVQPKKEGGLKCRLQKLAAKK